MGFRRRHETTHLGKNDDEGVLPKIGRLACHVGACQKAQTLGLAGYLAVIGDKGPGRLVLQGCLDHRVAAGPDLEVR